MLHAVQWGSGLYDTVLFLHILFAVVGFGSTFVWPVLSVKARASGDATLMAEVGRMSEAGSRVFEPFILGNGVFGLLLVIFGATSDPSYWEFSDPWITIAMTLYLAALVLSLGFHLPNLKRMGALQEEMLAAGPPAPGQAGPPPQAAEIEARGKKAAMYGGILHVAFVLILLDMVFKPF